MGFWKKSKVDQNAGDKQGEPWIDLNSEEQLEEIIERSFEKPQLIFKHSTRCGISSMVKNRFISEYRLNNDEADLYYLDLLKYRRLSELISDRFDVWHESPQLIIIRQGKVWSHASHGSILDLKLDLDSN